VSSILVLDDRATDRDLLSTVLGYAGHIVTQASTGEEALGLVRTSRPELVIVDLMMAHMNGPEFVRALRADPGLEDVKVVFCTATYDEREVRELAQSCGVLDTLVKPCEPEEIIRVVGGVLGATLDQPSQMIAEHFDRAQQRVLNTKLIEKIDELGCAKRRIEEKAEQLAISSKYRAEFFSNMSHELRTPLNSLLILAGELKANHDQNLTETQVEYADIIHSSGADLLRVLNDVLDLAKVESGTVKLNVSDLALLDLQGSLEGEFRHVAEQRGVTFCVGLAPGTPPIIATDPGRLRQVLKNLLANAFKFTVRGAVTVRISRADPDWVPANVELRKRGEMIAFAISDTGIGIAEEAQQPVFEAFVQADGTSARQHGGTGLGLSISRELAELLGGEIALESTVGKGSTFTVYLPFSLAGDHPVPSPPADTAAVHSGLAGKKVLVVDDDLRNIVATTALLERSDMEVISAESGAEGMALLKQTPDLDIVLMDIMMPVMDGYETMRAMRRLVGIGSIPIVALTAKTGHQEVQRCLDAGASAYVPKPISAGELLDVLDEWLPRAATVGRAVQVPC
jgi:two-component system, chemotaxis family, sensor kinase CheA